MDTFLEKMVARKRMPKDGLIAFGIILAGFAVIGLIMSIPLLGSLALLLSAGVAYGVYYFIKSTNIEFEYAVTNGDLDIDKIIAQRKRKRIFTGNCKDFEIVAKLKGDKYTDEYKNITKKIEAVSTMESSDVYFVVTSCKGERTIVFFEPNKRMIDAFKVFIPRKVFEY